MILFFLNQVELKLELDKYFNHITKLMKNIQFHNAFLMVILGEEKNTKKREMVLVTHYLIMKTNIPIH